MAIKDLRINKQIRAKEVFVINASGEQKGVMSIYDAVNLADAEGLDLVEVSPNAKPPVCKILDFGKYRYEQEKRIREAKKNQTIIKVKEIRMQPKIERNDLVTKSKFIAEFLGEGNKVKVGIRFRGRELAHTELGKVVLDKILNELSENGVQFNIDRRPIMEGKMMSMMISPKKVNKKN
jgi:translation initiation factor IF-3